MKLKFWKRDRRPQAVVVWCDECRCWHVRPVNGTVPHELKFTSILRAADQANSAGYRVVA